MFKFTRPLMIISCFVLGKVNNWMFLISQNTLRTRENRKIKNFVDPDPCTMNPDPHHWLYDISIWCRASLAHILPDYGCLILSPANIWRKDPVQFQVIQGSICWSAWIRIFTFRMGFVFYKCEKSGKNAVW